MTKTSDAKFQNLLNRCAKIAEKHMLAMAALEPVFLERYGKHYSEVDADLIIEVLDLSGGSITVADCDEQMLNSGWPKLDSK